MSDVALAGILGAIALAVFLLHWVHQRYRETTTQLSVPSGDRAQSVWQGHRAATITVTAATVAVAGALVLTSGGGTPRTATAAPPTTASGSVPDAGQDGKGHDRDAEHSPAEDGDDAAVTHDDSDTRTFSGPGSVAPTEGEPTPGTSSTPASGDGGPAEPTEGTTATGSTTAPGPPETTAPGPSASPTTTPPPPTPKPTAPQKPEQCDGLIDLHLPLLPDVCLM
ncbi:hypothetical protein [Streptomyces sp. NBC_00316]|uniref:hypothetical protein n=1 Tax=Streptomyces sp. NBC_00316 TaxID=2975710 RepID=UPI002E2945CE|nr:hypothetical protein [Streptomyces sp. NBC_00316]